MDSSTIFDSTSQPIYLITACRQGRLSGMIATWVMSASLLPERGRIVLVLSPCNRTTSTLLASGRLAIHLLARDQLELVARFGLHSSAEYDKFADLAYRMDEHGVPILSDCCGSAGAVVAARLDDGDRIVVVAHVDRHEHNGAKRALSMDDVRQHASAETLEALNRQHARDIQRDRQLLSDPE